MAQETDLDRIAAALYTTIGLIVRRLRQAQAGGELTLPESAALARLDRGGPTTASALARLEQISPQSMGATLSGLEARGFVERRPDPEDGRCIVLSTTETGLQALRTRRDTGTRQLAQAMATEFTPSELRLLNGAAPLLERLAQRI